MTADVLTRPRPQRPQRPRVAVPTVPVVPLVMASVLLLRLPFIGRPATPDEAGFLVVASQWHLGGTSLYGNYWVDRPPLLIGIFRLADLAGGLTALRILGALAAAATVALLAATARRAFGRRAAGWTAVVAGALLVSPLLGAQAVNGELLAAPFIALGLRLAVEAVYAEDPLTARGAALATGSAAVLALLVKQNMADVVVFAAVCWVVAWRTRRVSGRTFADLVALAAVGAVVAYAVVMLWAMAHGTSPLAVYDATYPFRVKAGDVIAAIPGDAADNRLSHLGLSALLSVAPLVLLAFAALAVRRTRQAPVVWAIVVAAAFACASILAGGSYWLHYLVQGVPAASLAAGALAAASVGAARVLVPAVVASAVVTLVASLASPAPAPGATVGRTLAASARAGDTVLSAFGDADIPRATGMSSPYPYLWSLPSRTLDPDMSLLRGILAGPEAPTWIVVRGSNTMHRLEDAGVRPLIETRYHVVGMVCGRSIYLQRGLDRSPLVQSGSCGGTVLP
jgi:4-amino-4-deoxy-L-arabinose transferase-like glycosyltransferase